MDMIKNALKLKHSELSEDILGCCFDVVNEIGSGFLENVYKNALYIALKQKGLNVSTEQIFEIFFRNQKIGKYIADLVVEKSIIVELKCCKALLPEHQAQLINYLKAADISVGLLVNFSNHKLEYKRVHHPNKIIDFI